MKVGNTVKMLGITVKISESYELTAVGAGDACAFKNCANSNKRVQKLQRKSAICRGAASWQQGGIARSYGDSWAARSQLRPDFEQAVFLSLCHLDISHYGISINKSIIFL